MLEQWFTPVGEYIRHIPQNISANTLKTDAMCAEHGWLTAGTVSCKFAFDKISENLVEI